MIIPPAWCPEQNSRVPSTMSDFLRNQLNRDRDLRLDIGMRRLLIVCGTPAATMSMPFVVVAQESTAPALKAAFIYNFVKFTTWPVDLPVSAPFVICVVGDAAVGDALKRLLEGREFAGRRMVAVAAATRPTTPCSVLYVSGATVGEVSEVIAGLQDLPVLTISDVVGFTDKGGMAQFFVDRGQLRFSIKVEAVKRSGLMMSSKLLTLGQR